MSQAIGRTVGGRAPKILPLTDTLGNLVRFERMAGQHDDTIAVPPLLDGVAFGGLIVDKAFDSHANVDDRDRPGAAVVIARRKNRLNKRPLDVGTFRWHHLIENFRAKREEFKRIAMRSDSTDGSFRAMIHLASAVSTSR